MDFGACYIDFERNIEVECSHSQ